MRKQTLRVKLRIELVRKAGGGRLGILVGTGLSPRHTWTGA